MAQTVEPIDTEEQLNPKELTRVLQSLKAGNELTDRDHSLLESAVSLVAKREPAMLAQIAYKQEVFVGPLPHPDQLNAYDDHTRRVIVDMAAKEQAHTHQMHTTGLSGAIWKDRIGQFFGFGIALAGLAAAAWMAQYSAAAAAIIGTLDLLGMVGIFVIPRAFEQRAIASAEKSPSTARKKPARKK